MVSGCNDKALLEIGHWFKSPVSAYLKKRNKEIK